MPLQLLMTLKKFRRLFVRLGLKLSVKVVVLLPGGLERLLLRKNLVEREARVALQLGDRFLFLEMAVQLVDRQFLSFGLDSDIASVDIMELLLKGSRLVERCIVLVVVDQGRLHKLSSQHRRGGGGGERRCCHCLNFVDLLTEVAFKVLNRSH